MASNVILFASPMDPYHYNDSIHRGPDSEPRWNLFSELFFINKLGHWYTSHSAIYLSSACVSQWSKQWFCQKMRSLTEPINIAWKVQWGHSSPLLFSKEHIVIILQYDSRDTVISDTILAWESSSKQPSTYFCEILIWHIPAHFRGPCPVYRNGKHTARLHLSSLSVIFAQFRTTRLSLYETDDDDDDMMMIWWWCIEHLTYAQHWAKNFLLFSLYDNLMIQISFLLSPLDKWGEIEAKSLGLHWDHWPVEWESELPPRFGCVQNVCP